MPVETAHAQATRAHSVRRDGDETASTADGEPVWVGLVRSPPEWFRRRVDCNRPALDLPDETRERLDRRRRDLRMQGLCAEGAHNAAWEELDGDSEYRAHLSSGDAQRAYKEVAALAARDDVVLVLATTRQPGFRGHRTVLASMLEAE